MTGVTIVRNGDDAVVTWEGKLTRGRQFNGFYINASGGNDVARQLGKKLYTDGSAPEQFIFDMGSARQQNLESDGSTLIDLQFPSAFAGMGVNVKLDGAVTADGVDREKCTVD